MLHRLSVGVTRAAWKALGIALCALSACTSVPAHTNMAAPSCPLDPQASFPIETQANLMFVKALIDGKPARLFLDTGAERSLITDEAADRIGLLRDPDRQTRLVGLGGAATTSLDANASTLVMGTAKVRGIALAVASFGHYEIAGAPIDGVLGIDVLSAFDVEIDTVQGQVTLYRARPCADSLPPWNVDFLTFESPGAVRSMFQVPIRLDGVNDLALLDTGARRSSVTMPLALSTGLTRDELNRDPQATAHGASPNAVKVYLHRFRSLQVGNTLVNRPVMQVLDVPPGPGPGAVLGANYIRERRLWLSFASRRFFLTVPVTVGAPAAAADVVPGWFMPADQG